MTNVIKQQLIEMNIICKTVIKRHTNKIQGGFFCFLCYRQSIEKDCYIVGLYIDYKCSGVSVRFLCYIKPFFSGTDVSVIQSNQPTRAFQH